MEAFFLLGQSGIPVGWRLAWPVRPPAPDLCFSPAYFVSSMTGANWQSILGAIVTVISVPASRTGDGIWD